MTGKDESRETSHAEREPDDEATRIASAPGFSSKPPIPAPVEGGRQSTIPPGRVLNHTYRVEALLARGGMGEVYRATHTDLGSEHAVKVILPELANDPKILDMFRREAESLRKVRDDAVVAYDGMFRDEDGRLYLVMEFVAGPSLSDVIRERRLTAAEVAQLRNRLAAGLGAAHDKGTIHRDISPDNIILPGSRLDDAKIIDFGIAKLTDPSAATIIGDDFAGKYSYVSPEQLGMFGGKVDARSDIYSLGLVLAAAAIGEPLDMGMSPISVVEARQAVPDLSRVPPELVPGLTAMLQPRPEDRPQSMYDLIDGAGAFGRAAAAPAGKAATPPKGSAPTGTGQPRKSRLSLIAAAAALAGVALAGGGYYVLAPGPETPIEPTMPMVAQEPSGGTGSAVPAQESPEPVVAETAVAETAEPPAAQPEPPAADQPAAQLSAQPPAPSQPSTSGETAAIEPTPPAEPEEVAASAAPVEPPTEPVARPEEPETQAAPPAEESRTGTDVMAAPKPEITPEPEVTPELEAAPEPEAAPVSPPVETEVAALPSAPPLPETPAIDPAAIRQEAERLFGTYQCAGLDATVTADGRLTAAGYVESADDQARLSAALADIPGVTAAEVTAAVRPWPHCEILGILGTHTRIDRNGAFNLSIQPNNQDLVYRDGDRMFIDVTATSLFDGHLSVSFIDKEGNVVHLFPMPLLPDNAVSAGERVALGDKREYLIGPPFGDDMLVAISSPSPLFADARPEVETAATYFAALREALEDVERRDGPPPISQYLFITSIPGARN